VERHRFDARERNFGPGFRRTHEATRPVSFCTLGGHEQARDGTEAAVEGKLTHGGVAGETACRDLMGRLEQGEGDRQVEAGALLPQVGRGEVDRDPAVVRPEELSRGDSASDSLLRLLAGAVGEPDDGERGDTALEMSLYLDAPRVETDKSVSNGSRQHVVIIDNRDPAFVTTL
jgi:hypothetical protein